MLLLDYQNTLLQSILTERFSGLTPPASIDQVVSDFDGVTFHISTPTTKSQILISLNIKCYKELVSYGAESVLQREYGSYITSPEPGYDFSILIDLENLPASPEERSELVNRIAMMKRNVMAAPFERAFEEFDQLSEEASKYTSESAPQGVQEGGQVMSIHYRDEEAIYIKASHDRVTVIFSTIFRDETDRIFGKVFLQEFVDARRRAIQNAPQVLFRSDAPLELQGLRGVGKTGEKGEVGYITFGKYFLLVPYSLLTKQFYFLVIFSQLVEQRIFLIFRHSEITSTTISRHRKLTFTLECDGGQQTFYKFSTVRDPKMRRKKGRRLLVEHSECKVRRTHDRDQNKHRSKVSEELVASPELSCVNHRSQRNLVWNNRATNHRTSIKFCSCCSIPCSLLDVPERVVVDTISFLIARITAFRAQRLVIICPQDASFIVLLIVEVKFAVTCPLLSRRI